MPKKTGHRDQNIDDSGYQTIVTALIPLPTEDPLQAGHLQWEKRQYINKSRTKTLTLAMKSNRHIDSDSGMEVDSGFLYGPMARRMLIVIFGMAKIRNTPILSLNWIILEMEKFFGMKFSGESSQNVIQIKKLVNAIYATDISVQYDKNPKIPMFDISINEVKRISISWQIDSKNIIKLSETFFQTQILQSGFSVDLKVLSALGRSSLAWDTYCWLNCRLRTKKKRKLEVPWERLRNQLAPDHDKKNIRQFKKRLQDVFDKHLYPACPALRTTTEITDKGLTIHCKRSLLEILAEFLKDGGIPHVGPALATKIASYFGEEVWAVAQRDCLRSEQGLRLLLQEVTGISTHNAPEIAKGIVALHPQWPIIVKLSDMGFNAVQSTALLRRYGNAVFGVLRRNPYRPYCELNVIEYSVVDELARSYGFPKDHPARIQACIVSGLKEKRRDGDCFATAGDLEIILDKQGFGSQFFKVIDSAVSQGFVCHYTGSNGARVFSLPSLFQAEKISAQRLLHLAQETPPWGILNPEEVIPLAEEETGLMLSADQRKAVALALSSKVAIITGGPGTGKTTALKVFLHIVREKVKNILPLAPTGKAACRLGETTCHDASTIHRALVLEIGDTPDHHCKNVLLDTELVIIDEASMLDVLLLKNVLMSIPPKAGVLIVGDADQLQSVGPGAVLKDMIESKRIPFEALTVNHRQSTGSPIIENSQRVLRGEMPSEDGVSGNFIIIECPENEIEANLLEVVCRILPERGFRHLSQRQVLSPRRSGPAGIAALNLTLQAMLSPSRKDMRLGMGDRVMQISTDYEMEKPVFNGQMGEIVGICPNNEGLYVLFDDRAEPIHYPSKNLKNLELAFACTIHKSQGSEYPAVIIPVSGTFGRMLTRNLLYTAITRAKEVVVLVGTRAAIRRAVSTLPKHRNTLLGDMLAGWN